MMMLVTVQPGLQGRSMGLPGIGRSVQPASPTFFSKGASSAPSQSAGGRADEVGGGMTMASGDAADRSFGLRAVMVQRRAPGSSGWQQGLASPQVQGSQKRHADAPKFFRAPRAAGGEVKARPRFYDPGVSRSIHPFPAFRSKDSLGGRG